jgi:hypothetical protein
MGHEILVIQGTMTGAAGPSGGGAKDDVAAAGALAALAGAAALVATATHGVIQGLVIVAVFVLIGWAALILRRRR